ncbi:MAG: ATP-binding cassette domain-containing protein [Ichthyobacteriaceae bacterium]|nr:ATP-binding cassette domain-containing protein [Ichthyobacteriaceae bacterium]
MITIKNLRKSFGDTEVLKGIDAEFYRGKINLIIGQSGSGKTVFLKSLIGLHVPNSGEIYFDDKNSLDLNSKEKKLLRMNIGMVFQGSALYDSMTVEENVMFPLRMFTDKSNDEMLVRVQEVLKRVNLKGSNDKYPSELSGGMQKRVAIARAISMKPRFLFCDEPNSGLDPKTAIVIDNLLKEITEENNITTIINTHDMNSVMEIGDNIIFLKDGVKKWNGSKEEMFVTDNEAIVDFVYSSELFRKIKGLYK